MHAIGDLGYINFQTYGEIISFSFYFIFIESQRIKSILTGLEAVDL
jgi:hypothetical protein